MTVTAIDPEPRDMMLVTKRYGLIFMNAGVGDVRRALEFHQNPAQSCHDEHRAEDRRPRQCVTTAMENLHRV